MTDELKKSIIGSAILVLLGLVALCIGIRFLVLLVPIAMLVWHFSQQSVLDGGARRQLRSSRLRTDSFDPGWENSEWENSGWGHKSMGIQRGTMPSPAGQRSH